MTTLIVGALVIAALGFGAVATGVVHVPGLESTTSTPTTTAVQSEPQQVSEGDHTIGVRFGMLTPDLAKSRQITTSRGAGLFFLEVLSGSPSEQAGIRTNDVVVAIDGVPIRAYSDAFTEIRLTPIGQQMAVTVERGGAVQNFSITVGRCLVREEGHQPGTDNVKACRAWTQ